MTRLQKFSAVMMGAITTMLLVGCSKEPPKCSDDETSSLVRKIILEKLGGSEELTEKEIRENLKIELPRATGFDEKIRKYSCEGKLIAGNSYQLPITYESQLDDQNQHIVSLDAISRNDQFVINMSIIESVKQSRAAQKTSSSENTQTSSKSTPSNIVGEWAGRLVGDGSMEIKPAATGYVVVVNVSDESGCAGSIEGSGTLSDNTMVLSKKEDDTVCKLTIKFSGNSAELTEDDCSGHHGLSCGFSGTLKKAQ
ncbi:MAG: hypothetical protein PHH47_13765 [Gallionella sp.]|nr:hypothetical protein [Gallionella sp.]MDD4947368.1 hypothetical protein [Gallionella sp.]